MDPAVATLIVGLVASPLVLKIFDRWSTRARRPRTVEERVGLLEDELRAVRIEQRHTLDYVEELRVHISTGRPPPPPKWPDELTR